MKRTLILVSVLAIIVAACGSGGVGSGGSVTLAPPETTVATPPETSGSGTAVTTTTEATQGTTPDETSQVFVELFFVKEGLVASSVLRAVEGPAVASSAIRALISGPTPAEADKELSSAIPGDTLLLGLTIEGGLATIDLSKEFEAGGGSFNILSRLAQVVYTLTQFPTVDQVLFHIDGQPVEVFSGEGVVLDGPVDRDDYSTILPIEGGTSVTTFEPWDQSDLDGLLGTDSATLGRVALVEESDVLNVRLNPGVSSPIVGTLLPGVIVQRTGNTEIAGSSEWVQVKTPAGNHWVVDRFLAAVVDPAEFADDDRVTELLDRFVDIVASDGDLRPVTSNRGLYVSHHADPIRFAPDQLETILTETTTYKWPSNALGTDDEEFQQIPGRTFAEAIADNFVSVYDDPDTMTTVNEPIEAGNGRLAEQAIPFEFGAFNYIGVHDPGDNPEYGGLDWFTWYVSIDYEDGRPVIVGLTIDQWAP